VVVVVVEVVPDPSARYTHDADLGETVQASNISYPLPSFGVHTRYAVLRLRTAPSWYGPAVTEQTLASQIRARAAELHYDGADADTQRALRRQIADELGTITQNVVTALKHRGQRGRARVHEERCPVCERAVLDNATREAIARNTAKPKRTKR